MSIIRQLARGFRPRFRASRCVACRKPVYVFECFCPRCGTANEAFEDKAFKTVAKSNLAAARKRCANGQIHEVEALARSVDPDLRNWVGRAAHCAICGQALPVARFREPEIP